MSNQITQKYDKWQGVAEEKVKEMLAEVQAKEDLKMGRELFRGVIYDRQKVGSVICEAEHRGEPAVLKLQILPLAMDETDIMKSFARQNRSSRVRMPHLRSGEKWEEVRGYGCQITERVDAPLIFENFAATEAEKQVFLDFFREYLLSIPAEPWFARANYDLDYAFARVDNWANISRERMKTMKAAASDLIFDWDKNGLAERVKEYKAALRHNQDLFRLKFLHMHLTREDVRVLPNGEFVIFSNLFWAWGPEWYDTTFHLWHTLKNSGDAWDFAGAKEYFQSWRELYESVPEIAADSNFDRKFCLLLLERILGIMLVDLWADSMKPLENLAQQKHLFELSKKLFEFGIEETGRWES